MKKRICSILLTVALMMNGSVLAIEPDDIARLVAESKTRLEGETFPQKPRSNVFVAVSLSMPKASLERLAKDAKDAQIPLVFRGVTVNENLRQYETQLSASNRDFDSHRKKTDDTPLMITSKARLNTLQNGSKTPQEELKVKVEVASKTMLERYGKHLLVRGLARLEWLISTGVTVQIDPQVFRDFAIDSVPVMVVVDPDSRHTNVKRYERIEGDVTLAYMLRALEKELKVKIDNESQRTDSNEEIIAYNKNVIGQISPLLARLGERE